MANWLQWQLSEAGQDLAAREYEAVRGFSQQLFGRQIVQLGPWGGAPAELFDSVRHHLLLDLNSSTRPGVIAHPDQLPIQSQSVNVVYLPHTLEIVDDPHAVLREVDRVLIPDGRLVLSVFNRRSLYGLWSLACRGRFPWMRGALAKPRLQDWLRLLGFEVQQLIEVGYRPPVKSSRLYQQLALLERLGGRCCPGLSSIMVLLAIKRTIPLSLVGTRRRGRKPFVSGRLVEPSTRGGEGV